MKKFGFFIAVVLLSTQFLCAQTNSVLSSLTFESHSKYMRPTTDDVNVRKNPSLNAPKVQLNKYPGALMECEMYPVLSENQGWYRIPEGWVSKTVSKQTVNKPITPSMMNNLWCGHVLGPGDGFMWRVYSPVGASQLAICDCSGVFRLGKLINNVFVFKYAVPMSIEIDNEHPNRWEIVKDEDSEYLFMGTTSCKKVTEKYDYDGSTHSYWLPDLSKFTDQQLTQIFQDVIKKNETDYYYLNSELLTGQWVGNIP